MGNKYSNLKYKERKCPVCNKTIKTWSHIARMNDEYHKEYIKKHDELSINLYNEYKNIFNVLADDRIILKNRTNDLLLLLYGQEIKETNRKIRNKKLSIIKTNENSEKQKMKKQFLDDIENGLEGINYVTCKICGYKGRQLISHITRIHNINKQQYLEKFPNCVLNCSNTNEKIINKMLERINNENKYDKSGLMTSTTSHYTSVYGVRKDLNEFYRSKWEANIARIFRLDNIKYKYEYKKFKLKYNENYLIYLPDFYLPEFDMYIEVKGRKDEMAILKNELFLNQYGNILMIDNNLYNLLEKHYSKKIKNWEK